ncbi:transporter associated domain-containing protein, partial [Dickeya solani]
TGQPVFNQQEQRMIERVLGMSQRSVSSIMTIRHDIEHVDVNIDPVDFHELMEKNQHTRLVMFDSHVSSEPLGVVHLIDLLRQQLHGQALNLRALIRQPLVFPEQLSLLSALEQFREAHTHFAFVADEFGSVEGIVTLSDVMETIAGNLPLEGEELDARHDIQENEDGTLTANGYLPVEDLLMYIPLQLNEKREYHTLAGLLMEYAQKIPQEGDEVRIDNALFQVLTVESHRIVKVLIIPEPHPQPDYEV